MNEIEIQKFLIKEAFNQQKVIPDFGNIGNDNAIKLRDYIWRVCNFLQENKQSLIVHKNGGPNSKPIEQGVSQNKKNALITMYKLWSAFTKNIRYMIGSKGKAVTLTRFGTFSRSS